MAHDSHFPTKRSLHPAAVHIIAGPSASLPRTFPRPSNLWGPRCDRPGNDTISCRAIRDILGAGRRLWIRMRSQAGKTSPARHTTQRSPRNNRIGPSSLQKTSTSHMGISAWSMQAEMNRDHNVLRPRLEMRLVCSRIW